MRIGTIGRVWFGFLFGRMILDFAEREAASRRRRASFHGFTWTQVERILTRCIAARPEFSTYVYSLDEDARRAYLGTVFTCREESFRAVFGFDRPEPAAL